MPHTSSVASSTPPSRGHQHSQRTSESTNTPRPCRLTSAPQASGAGCYYGFRLWAERVKACHRGGAACLQFATPPLSSTSDQVVTSSSVRPPAPAATAVASPVPEPRIQRPHSELLPLRTQPLPPLRIEACICRLKAREKLAPGLLGVVARSAKVGFNQRGVRFTTDFLQVL